MSKEEEKGAMKATQTCEVDVIKREMDSLDVINRQALSKRGGLRENITSGK